MPYLDRDGYRLYYTWDGPEEAPVVMLSHSLGAHLGMWDPQIEALSQHFRVLRYDHPGHGQSDYQPGPTTIADSGADALALLDALALDKVLFCGLSLGGMTGMWLGAHAPQRFTRMVLSSTAAYIQDTKLLGDRIALIRREGWEAITDSVMAGWFTQGFATRHPDRIAWAREMLLTTQAEAYADVAQMVGALDLRADLPGIRLPVLVISGTEDRATPPTWNRAIQKEIPHAQWCSLEGAHLINVEANGAFTASIVRFFA